MHCLVKNRQKDLANFSVNVTQNRKNPPTQNHRRRRHHQAKMSNRRAPIDNQIKRNLNLNRALAAVIKVRMVKNQAAKIIRNVKNGSHSA